MFRNGPLLMRMSSPERGKAYIECCVDTIDIATSASAESGAQHLERRRSLTPVRGMGRSPPILPRRRGTGIGPEAAPREARVRFELGEQRIPGVAPEPPRGAGADELLVQAPAVGQANLAEPPAVAV